MWGSYSQKKMVELRFETNDILTKKETLERIGTEGMNNRLFSLKKIDKLEKEIEKLKEELDNIKVMRKG